MRNTDGEQYANPTASTLNVRVCIPLGNINLADPPIIKMTVSSTPFRPPKTWPWNYTHEEQIQLNPFMQRNESQSSIKLLEYNLYLNYSGTLRTYSRHLQQSFQVHETFQLKPRSIPHQPHPAPTLQHHSHPIAHLKPDELKNLQSDSSVSDHCRQRHHPLRSDSAKITLDHVPLHPHRLRPHAVNNE